MSRFQFSTLTFLHECIDISFEYDRQERWTEAYEAMLCTQSPIEERLLCALAFMPLPIFLGHEDRNCRPFFLIDGSCSYDLSRYESWVLIEPQAKILNYRADFLITAKFCTSDCSPKIVVECDGHDFHERTKEQASRDKRRDREMVSDGYTVLRFTGSEIFRDATACASEVSKILKKAEWDARSE